MFRVFEFETHVLTSILPKISEQDTQLQINESFQEQKCKAFNKCVPSEPDNTVPWWMNMKEVCRREEIIWRFHIFADNEFEVELIYVYIFKYVAKMWLSHLKGKFFFFIALLGCSVCAFLKPLLVSCQMESSRLAAAEKYRRFEEIWRDDRNEAEHGFKFHPRWSVKVDINNPCQDTCPQQE